MGSQERNALILKHAAELFADRGISATTVRDIAGRAGILSGSLYHYFPSKDALADQIVMSYLGALIGEYEQIVASPLGAREALTRRALASSRGSSVHTHASEIFQRETAYLRQLPSHEAIRAATRTIRETWVTVLERGRAAGELRADLPVELLYLLIRDAVWLTLRSFAPTDDIDADALAAGVVSVFLDGAAVRAPGTGAE